MVEYARGLRANCMSTASTANYSMENDLLHLRKVHLKFCVSSDPTYYQRPQCQRSLAKGLPEPAVGIHSPKSECWLGRSRRPPKVVDCHWKLGPAYLSSQFIFVLQISLAEDIYAPNPHRRLFGGLLKPISAL